MKLGILSDIHGNIHALEAVIADARKKGVNDFVFLGDLIMKGPASDKCLALLETLNLHAWVRGNCDECFLAEQKPFSDDSRFISSIIYANYEKQFLTEKQITFLLQRPIKQTICFEGIQFDFFHATPTHTSAYDLLPTEDQKHFDAVLKDSLSFTACYGHTHQPLMRRTTDGRIILNPGTIGLSYSFRAKHDPRAEYAIVTIDKTGVSHFAFCKISYDFLAEQQLAKKRELPYYELYAKIIETGAATLSRQNYHTFNMTRGYRDEVRRLYAKKGE